MKECQEGCNTAEFRLVNGEEESLLCSVSFASAIMDLVTNNETITFTLDLARIDYKTYEVEA